MDALVYYNYFATAVLFHQKGWYRWLNRINLFLLIVELFLFYTVTFVSSKENMGRLISTKFLESSVIYVYNITDFFFSVLYMHVLNPSCM